MRLFKSITALSAVALAGDKFQATPTERDCLSHCKRKNECQGQEITKDYVPECITNCRNICNTDRKEAVKLMLGRSSAKNSKADVRKQTNVAARAEHRDELKAAQPAPMIKEIHEIRDEGDAVAELFLACLKTEKVNLGCHGKGPGEAWDCKREMVDNCLEQNTDFEEYDSAAIAAFIAKFRESEIIAANTKDYLKRKTEQEEMANDVCIEMPGAPCPNLEPKVVTLGERFDKNSKGKVKVGFVRRQQKESKDNIDTTNVGLEHQAAALAYVNSQSDEGTAVVDSVDNVYDTEETEFDFGSFEYTSEESSEDAEIGFDFSNIGDVQAMDAMDAIGGADFDEEASDAPKTTEAPEAEEAELEGESEPKHHKKHHNGGKGKKHEKEDKESKDGKDHEKDGKDKKKVDGARPALFTLTYKNKDGVDKAKQATKTAHGHKQMKERNQHKLSEEKFITEMCRCRTSMEHYHIKNYLHRHGELKDWKHKEDTCKWCAYPSSKKCWQCQKHWQNAADHADNDEDRQRNEIVEMSCFLYTRNVKNGKFHPMNGKHNDPCRREEVHDGQFNDWHTNHKEMASMFSKYHELKGN